MCFAMGATSVMPVEAAMSPRSGEICGICRGTMDEITDVFYIKDGEEKCEKQEHQSLSCRIKYQLYSETLKLKCNKCENYIIIRSDNVKRNVVHSCISEQKL